MGWVFSAELLPSTCLTPVQMTADASIFPHILHTHERIQLAPQLPVQWVRVPVQWVRVRRQTPRAGERRLRRQAAAPGEAANPPQSPTSDSRCGAGAQPESRPLRSPSCWGGLKFLWLRADDIPGPRARGHKEIFLLLQQEAR